MEMNIEIIRKLRMAYEDQVLFNLSASEREWIKTNLMDGVGPRCTTCSSVMVEWAVAAYQKYLDIEKLSNGKTQIKPKKPYLKTKKTSGK